MVTSLAGQHPFSSTAESVARTTTRRAQGTCCRLVLLALCAGSLPACPPPGPDKRIVNVDDLFWRAWRNPETFDSYLASASVDPKAAECLTTHSNAAFGEQQKQLRECAALVSGSDLWNACHERAEQAQLRGVILRDISAAVQGRTKFSQTQGGQYLIMAKALVGVGSWYEGADLARAVAPSLTCEVSAELPSSRW